MCACGGFDVIIHAEQDDTGAFLARHMKQLGEVQVLGENDVLVFPRPVHQLGIRGVALADMAPVAGVPAMRHK